MTLRHFSTFVMTARAATLALGVAAIGLAAQTLPAAAGGGGPFAPFLIVNGQVISNYEYDQRVAFLQLLHAPGNIEDEAKTALIDDRLGVQAAKALSINLSDDAVRAGMDEFAQRAGLSLDDFSKALEEAGIARETLRDYVRGGLLWREVVRAKFGGQVRFSDTQADRAMADQLKQPDLKLKLSELVIPVVNGDEGAAVDKAKSVRAEILAGRSFADAAKAYSAANSAPNGGQLDWLPYQNLPPMIARELLKLRVGGVSDPVTVSQAVALFQLNGLSEADGNSAVPVAVDYGTLTLVPGQDAAAIMAHLDSCGDLFRTAREQKAGAVAMATQTMAEVPRDIGLALSRLDGGETTLLSRGGQSVIVMLCARRPVLDAPKPAAEPAKAEEAKPADQPASDQAASDQAAADKAAADKAAAEKAAADKAAAEKDAADKAAADAAAAQPSKSANTLPLSRATKTLSSVTDAPTTPAPQEPEDLLAAARNAMIQQLGGQRLSQMADGLMAAMRSEAIIVQP